MAFLSGIGAKLLAGLAVVALIVAVVLRWGAAERAAGRNLERAEALKQKVRNAEERRDVEAELDALPAGDPERQRLRDKWTRE